MTWVSFLYVVAALVGGGFGARLAKATIWHGVLAAAAGSVVWIGTQLMGQPFPVMAVASLIATMAVALAFGMTLRQAIIVLVVSQVASFIVGFAVGLISGIDGSLSHTGIRNG